MTDYLRLRPAAQLMKEQNPMSISSHIRHADPRLDPPQLAVVGHLEGPLLVRAGPGAGKTRVLVWRLINLLLHGACAPEETVLLAFGRLAAAEMRQRFEATAHAVGYRGDADRVRIATIHSLSHRVLREHHRRIGLRSDHRVLTREDQRAFMSEHFDEIFGPRQRQLASYGWKDANQVLTNAARCFDRITEECVSPWRMVDSGNQFHELIGLSYLAYEDALLKRGCADFSHLLLWADHVLADDGIADHYGSGIRHIMVDEYQDVSDLMERVVLRVGKYHDNPAVVGDPDQSIYAFRGAGPEALLGFPDHFENCRVLGLNTNYRSHAGINRVCNALIADTHRDAGDPRAQAAYHEMTPHAPGAHPDYPSVFTVWGRDGEEETEHLLDVVRFLRSHRIVADYSEIALLVHSVKERVVRPYAEAFRCERIPVHRSDSASADDPLGSGRSWRRGRERLPRGKLCIMTMHASKGLEWPVVIVATAEPLGRAEELDDVVRRYRRRRGHGLGARGGDHDRRRQYYVACTRAQDLLVLTGSRERPPAPAFDAVWSDLARWPSIDHAALARQRFTPVEDGDPPSPVGVATIDRLEHVRWRPKR